MNKNEQHYSSLLRQAALDFKSNEEMDKLIKSGANPEALDNTGTSILQLVLRRALIKSVITSSLSDSHVIKLNQIPEDVEQNIIRLVNFFHNYGGLNFVTTDRDLLHEACSYNLLKVASRLLELGYNVNQLNRYGETPLHTVNHSTANVSEWLLARGAKPNVQRLQDEDTALHIAVRLADYAAVAVLIRGGADANIKNFANLRPLDLIVCHSQSKNEEWVKEQEQKATILFENTKAVNLSDICDVADAVKNNHPNLRLVCYSWMLRELQRLQIEFKEQVLKLL